MNFPSCAMTGPQFLTSQDKKRDQMKTASDRRPDLLTACLPAYPVAATARGIPAASSRMFNRFVKADEQQATFRRIAA